jgi:hypothetical protein
MLGGGGEVCLSLRAQQSNRTYSAALFGFLCYVREVKYSEKTQKRVMLNAVKHLYRIVAMPSNDAVEMLHCVQHDTRLQAD